MRIKIKKFILIVLGNKFLSSLIFFFLAIIVSFFIFLKYDPKEIIVDTDKIPSFDRSVYDNINNKRNEEKLQIINIKEKEYINIFKKEQLEID